MTKILVAEDVTSLIFACIQKSGESEILAAKAIYLKFYHNTCMQTAPLSQCKDAETATLDMHIHFSRDCSCILKLLSIMAPIFQRSIAIKIFEPKARDTFSTLFMVEVATNKAIICFFGLDAGPLWHRPDFLIPGINQ